MLWSSILRLGPSRAQKASAAATIRVLATRRHVTRKIVNGKVFRNGVQEHGDYIEPCTTGPSVCNFPAQITVPAGHYYMMGDNRSVSDDSRFWGPVPQSAIVGTAFFTYWPLDRIGTL
jgi:signal peptidase I